MAETFEERTRREREEARRVAEQRVNGNGSARHIPPQVRVQTAGSGLATSREARANAAQPPQVVRGEVITGPGQRIPGAVKVAGFPVRTTYPFPAIAEDGGVWRIDPAEHKVTAGTIRAAASKWAAYHNLKVKTMVDGGLVYVQFRRPS